MVIEEGELLNLDDKWKKIVRRADEDALYSVWRDERATIGGGFYIMRRSDRYYPSTQELLDLFWNNYSSAETF